MSKGLSTKPYKGTRDFYPEDMRIQKWMFDRMGEVVERYGYEPYDGPMLESFDLYAAKTGEEIVNQQLYWFMDRGERKLAVRPEMTPTLARMVAGRLQELPKPIRWYSFPNLWRYERPQRGRLREHWQLNVDVMGGDRRFADAEVLNVALDIVRAFGGLEHVQILVNHRGLMDEFFSGLGLGAEAALKVTKAVDARAKIGEEKYTAWLDEVGLSAGQREDLEGFFGSKFADVKGGRARDELAQLFDDVGSELVAFDPKVLRGMDYYTGTVFEMYDTSPENNRAMFGGGRYDGLMGLFGKQPLGGVGFGWGDVTLRNFLETHKLLPDVGGRPEVCVTLGSKKSPEVAAHLRKAGLRVVTPLEELPLGKQLKVADKLGARFAVILGEEELAQGKATVKELATGEQKQVALGDLESFIKGE